MARIVTSLLVLLAFDAATFAQWSAEVERGVAWLVTRQRDDGSFDAGPSAAETTALATLAMLAAGHEPDLGRHGLALRRAIDFLQREVPRVADPRGSSLPRERAAVLLSLLEAASIEPDTTRRQRQVASLAELARSLEASGRDDRETLEWIGLARETAARIGLLEATPATLPDPATPPHDASTATASLAELLRYACTLAASGSDAAEGELASLLREIARRQDRDGGWSEGSRDPSRRVVATATAVLALSLPSRHLPRP